jgi:hypothetical protein|tara:strand:- start:447 stop:608 length:162 start_codon:yes stop_codon:yes gene_type:complete
MNSPKKIGDWIHIHHTPQETLKLHKIKLVPLAFEKNKLATNEEVIKYLKTNIN